MGVSIEPGGIVARGHCSYDPRMNRILFTAACMIATFAGCLLVMESPAWLSPDQAFWATLAGAVLLLPAGVAFAMLLMAIVTLIARLVTWPLR